ncbi:uncharacterized protein LOC9655368 [Selaginella moellendorffii]|uniref:uncharacterized protein LOC9655368 n=1 Tax=Selaginella moellendorffii TaxID=88036 RepID=UPI000D1D0971|nr:uncharacterized protein LOC9655368 [Selaginella moellendorffii]|eukprot:XP_024526217.1 uncharacterized protein LOC9655368 [Selaginella moellendorffii]
MSLIAPVLSSINAGISECCVRRRECRGEWKIFGGYRAGRVIGLHHCGDPFHGFRRRIVVAQATAQESSPEGRADADARSYLSMWKNAKERYEREQLQQNASTVQQDRQPDQDREIQSQREKDFARLLDVPQEERDRVHRLQVIDRAAAALAAAEALLASRPRAPSTIVEKKWEEAAARGWEGTKKLGDLPRRSVVASAEPATTVVSPGPDFWTWTPPPPPSPVEDPSEKAALSPKTSQSETQASNSVLEKEREAQTLELPFETENARSVLPLVFQSRAAPSLPPLQSLVEIKENVAATRKKQITEVPTAVLERDKLADSVVHQDLQTNKTKSTTGVNPDGSRWWKETGEEDRGNGVVCSWSVTRGVSSEGVVEWEEKFWEACDDFDYKELGSEKSGRDASGNVWREFWKETIWQDAKSGLLHMEKSAEKWGKNGTGAQWDEKWWEHYDASGRAEKWADKWSVIDPNTPLEPGHGHVWHERWGEEFDGQGGAMKYTDKWAERSDFGGWTKWGDKWDERFDKNGVGKKQGETWWAGTNGDRWNRTWGEQHNGTGWVHKYGSSSSGEFWDTHEEQETWYEKFPHFGFHHCMENSQELHKVSKKKKKRL